ncbi:MAG: RNA 2',3'-cyclic phosphodiesterase [Lysobacter sp.]|nr:RNA 2',3'-cyclic phosphodiesterase [Lysobacter sp.]
MARLFFALWPDAAARAALGRLAAEVSSRTGGRPVAAAKLHLTLVFLGEVDPARIPALASAAQGVAAEAFDLALDRLGAFARARVAWAGCERPPEKLLAMQAQLERRVRDAGFAPDDRPYAAHLTLARRARAPLAPERVDPVTWRVATFALVESVPGEGTYRTLAEWALEPEKTKGRA